MRFTGLLIILEIKMISVNIHEFEVSGRHGWNGVDYWFESFIHYNFLFMERENAVNISSQDIYKHKGFLVKMMMFKLKKEIIQDYVFF